MPNFCSQRMRRSRLGSIGSPRRRIAERFRSAFMCVGMTSINRRIRSCLLSQRTLTAVAICAALLQLVCGCRTERKAQRRIDATRRQDNPSAVRAALLPLFADYHYDRNAPSWSPPNLVILDPVPKEVRSLPLFADLPAGQKLKLCTLQEDTNALTIFTSAAAKLGARPLPNRSETQRELPDLKGVVWSSWDSGPFLLHSKHERPGLMLVSDTKRFILPNKPPGANSRHVSRGRSGGFGVAAVAQAERSLT